MIISERSKNLLTDLQAKKITRAQFLKECALWALTEGFEQIKPMLYPAKPSRVEEFEAKAKRIEEPLDWRVIFWDNPEVLGYYKRVLEVKYGNYANACYLKDLHMWLEGDETNRAIVCDRAWEFAIYDDETIKKTDKTVQKIKAVFNAREA